MTASCGHPNHGGDGHDCRHFVPDPRCQHPEHSKLPSGASTGWTSKGWELCPPAVPDPRFRDQLAGLFPHAWPSNGLVGSCEPGKCWCGADRRLAEAERLIAAEVEARVQTAMRGHGPRDCVSVEDANRVLAEARAGVQAAANQRAAEMLRHAAESAPVVRFDNDYPVRAVPVSDLLSFAAALDGGA